MGRAARLHSPASRLHNEATGPGKGDRVMGTGIAIGLAVGVALGLTVLDNLAVGIAIGLVAGLAGGRLFQRGRS